MIKFFETCLKILQKNYASIILGVQTTLLVAFTGTIIGFILGLIVGGIKAIKLDKTASPLSRTIKKIYDVIATIYIEVFRGTPMMIQALFLYYALRGIIGWDILTAAISVLSINTGAYMSEIIRGGIQSVDNGQTEAARSLGLSGMQTMMSVVLPQAIKNSFPAIGNEFIVNIKDSSVLMVLSITELMFQSKSIAGSNLKLIETYFIAACIYLILTSITSILLRLIEKRINHMNISIPNSDTNVSSMKITTQEKR